ncbi:MAG TPA: hypothetical protein VMM12_17170 [Longimicrobiales bacterium]|nr:hypothetical protein [Longimicrobiales bacterium]
MTGRGLARVHPGGRPASRRAAAALVAIAALGSAAPGALHGQELRAAVIGDTIRVGDVVPVALRTTVSPSQRVLWPDTLPLGGPGAEMENAARVRTRQDTLPDGRIRVTGVYAVTPWRTGEAALPEVSVQVVSGDEGVRTLTAAPPPFEVVSVLPADTAGVQPRPAKGVIGRSWSWWPLLLALVALLAVAALGWWLWRRHRRAGAPAPLVPALPPREAALAALDRVRQSGLAERGEMKEFYTRIATAIRELLAALEPAWGEDRTTTELLAAVRAEAGPATAAELAPILRDADQVKFARRQPDRAAALAEWERARAWVAAFRWKEPPAGDVEEAA